MKTVLKPTYTPSAFNADGLPAPTWNNQPLQELKKRISALCANCSLDKTGGYEIGKIAGTIKRLEHLVFTFTLNNPRDFLRIDRIDEFPKENSNSAYTSNVQLYKTEFNLNPQNRCIIVMFKGTNFSTVIKMVFPKTLDFKLPRAFDNVAQLDQGQEIRLNINTAMLKLNGVSVK